MHCTPLYRMHCTPLYRMHCTPPSTASHQLNPHAITGAQWGPTPPHPPQSTPHTHAHAHAHAHDPLGPTHQGTRQEQLHGGQHGGTRVAAALGLPAGGHSSMPGLEGLSL